MDTSKGTDRVDRPVSEDEERENRSQALGAWLSSEGPFVLRLETEFAARVGRDHAIAVRDGSTALDLAIASLGIGRDDEVILPTFTSVTTATAIARTGAILVFIDSDPLTWNLDVNRIEAKITPKTRAILVTHTYGWPVEMTPVLQLAEKYGLWTIEDAAELHGQTYRGQPCGSFGDIATFCFYRDRLVTPGEGGIIVTDNATLAERCRQLRDLSARSAAVLSGEETDRNPRMNNFQAALGFAHLERLEEFIARKRRIGELYMELLADVPGLQLPISSTDRAENLYSVYGLVLLDGVPLDAREMTRQLVERGIETRPFFYPVHEQPEFREKSGSPGETFPVAERLYRRGFKIPSGTTLKDEQIVKVATAIQQILSS
ncbi:DegT/DnrJ/EryC1/StrS family aminotransferase [Pannus brasiliensis CCIBt3594]|uniref:DegT/DnrJ/EryC1/StrS family aminotransferase n=1 Tax=Pannus brasiliensis CCIBt3594 TaxID=1427578 RepID=A0AAW9QSB5_9CHRO